MSEKELFVRFLQMGLVIKILSNDGLNFEVEIFSKEHGALHTTVRVDILSSEEAYYDWLLSLQTDYPQLIEDLP